MMNKERIYYLHDRFLKGSLNPSERLEWKKVIEDPLAEDQLLLLIENSWKNIPDSDLSDIENARSEEILSEIVRTHRTKKRIYRLWPRIVAAAIITIIFGGTLFYYRQPIKEVQYSIDNQKNDIVAGKFAATLTLADGTQIRLDSTRNGKLAQEDGIVITKSLDGQLVYEIKGLSGESDKINTLSTARGEIFQIRLPDGSRVWLNAASSLTYSPKLRSHGKRRVILKGEGYFEVVKDKAFPFIVETKGQEVEVLGTHFNVSSYDDDPIKRTTLLEGSVKIHADGSYKILKPGQECKLRGGQLSVSPVDTYLATAWKNNEFMFESEPIENVMKMVERWYDVEIIYIGPKTHERFSGGVSRFDNISKVLEIIESTEAAHFKIEGRKIYVSK